MLISGKMSVGVRISTTGVSKITTSAITMNVYGLDSARRTIHMLSASPEGEFQFLNHPCWRLSRILPLSNPRSFRFAAAMIWVRHDPRRTRGYAAIPLKSNRLKDLGTAPTLTRTVGCTYLHCRYIVGRRGTKHRGHNYQVRTVVTLYSRKTKLSRKPQI